VVTDVSSPPELYMIHAKKKLKSYYTRHITLSR
jgi:hypothetical protein